MKSFLRPRLIAATAVGCALFAIGSAARADVYFSAGFPVYAEPAPVYVQPQPVYADPQPAVVAPYAPVYQDPQYSWREREEWRHRYWEHRRWEHRQWERRHHRDWDDGDD